MTEKESWAARLKSERITGEEILNSIVHEPPAKTVDGVNQWGMIWEIVNALSFQQLKDVLSHPIESIEISLVQSLFGKTVAVTRQPSKLIEQVLRSQHVLVSACYYNLTAIPCWKEALEHDRDAVSYTHLTLPTIHLV